MSVIEYTVLCTKNDIAIRCCDLCPWCLDLDLGNLVEAALSKIMMPSWLVCVGKLPMKGRCAWT